MNRFGKASDAVATYIDDPLIALWVVNASEALASMIIGIAAFEKAADKIVVINAETVAGLAGGWGAEEPHKHLASPEELAWVNHYACEITTICNRRWSSSIGRGWVVSHPFNRFVAVSRRIASRHGSNQPTCRCQQLLGAN